MYTIGFIVLSSLLIALIGRRSRFGFWGMLFASLLFTPIIGVLLLLVMTNTPPEKA
ncbi:MAG: hypothetical protein ACNI27_06410 [Desulfovibrio sp.]